MTYIHTYVSVLLWLICRKQFYAINAQLLGDPYGYIRDLEVQWPGVTHDARIWRNSIAQLRMKMQVGGIIAHELYQSNAKTVFQFQNPMKYAVAGDSAYTMSRVLVKPFDVPNTPEERTFNYRQSGLRTVCTENIIAALVNRFPILGFGKRGGISCYSIEMCLKIIRLEVYIHNG